MSDKNFNKHNPVLTGARRRGDRTRRDGSYEPRPVEVDPDGALKVRVNKGAPKRRLASGTLAGSAGSMFKAFSSYVDVDIYIANVDTSARTFTLYHVPNGDSAADANCIGKTVQLAVGGVVSYEGLTLSNGEFLSGLCSSANKASYVVYGVPV